MKFIKKFEEYLLCINEGVIKTYPSKIVVKEIRHQLEGLRINNKIYDLDECITIEIFDFNKIPYYLIENLFEVIFASVVNRGGWFPSEMKLTNLFGNIITKNFNMDIIIENYKNIESIYLKFESKFDCIEINIPNKLYHLSIKQYENKILKEGLSPKSKSKLSLHPDRIYLCKTIQDCEFLIPVMKFKYTEEKIDKKLTKNIKFDKNTDFIIFEIDNSDNIINNSNNLLYKDPNYNNGYYIINNIKPEYISKNKEF